MSLFVKRPPRASYCSLQKVNLPFNEIAIDCRITIWLLFACLIIYIPLIYVSDLLITFSVYQNHTFLAVALQWILYEVSLWSSFLFLLLLEFLPCFNYNYFPFFSLVWNNLCFWVMCMLVVSPPCSRGSWRKQCFINMLPRPPSPARSAQCIVFSKSSINIC